MCRKLTVCKRTNCSVHICDIGLKETIQGQKTENNENLFFLSVLDVQSLDF